MLFPMAQNHNGPGLVVAGVQYGAAAVCDGDKRKYFFDIYFWTGKMDELGALELTTIVNPPP